MLAGAGWGARGRSGARGLGPGSGLSGAVRTSGSHGEQAPARPLCGGGSRARVGGRARLPAGGLDLGPRGGRDPVRLACPRPLQPLRLLLVPPGRRRPATRSPWALRSSEVLRERRGAGVPTSPGAPRTFSPGFLPPSLLEGTRAGCRSSAPAANQSPALGWAGPAPASHWAPRARGWEQPASRCEEGAGPGGSGRGSSARGAPSPQRARAEGQGRAPECEGPSSFPALPRVPTPGQVPRTIVEGPRI